MDVSQLSRRVMLLAVRLQARRTGEFLKALQGSLLHVPRVTSVQKDIEEREPPTRLILLDEKVHEVEDLPEDKQRFLREQGDGVEFVRYPFEFGYSLMTAGEALAQLLPEGVEPVSSFETVGHIIHVNLRESQLPYKEVIGKVLLDKNRHVRTVVNKLTNIGSLYREFKMEVIAGEDDFLVELREHGFRFRFDYSKVYWNSRLSTEHHRLSTSFGADDVVCDACCGVGPFAIPAASVCRKVLANDLNPASVEALRENMALNHLEDRVVPHNMDARDFLRMLVDSHEPFHHVIMNLPASAASFLDVFRGLYADPASADLPLPRVHCYTFFKGEGDFLKGALAECEHYLGTEELSAEGGAERFRLELFDVRNVAPNKQMVRVSFQLPPSVAYRQAGVKRSLQASQGTDPPSAPEGSHGEGST